MDVFERIEPYAPILGVFTAIMLLATFSIEIKAPNASQEREIDLLEQGYFRIKTLEAYPRPSDIESKCGSVEYLVTNHEFQAATKYDVGGEFILFCMD